MVGQLSEKKNNAMYLMVVNKNRHSRQTVDFDVLVDGIRVSSQTSLLNVVNNEIIVGAYRGDPDRLSFVCELNAGEGIFFKLQKQ